MTMVHMLLQAGMCDTEFFDIEKTSIFGRGFCNINNNFNSSSKHFAISISISILPQCISRYQYQFQYSLKGFCNTNTNFNIVIKHFSISIPISISEWHNSKKMFSSIPFQYLFFLQDLHSISILSQYLLNKILLDIAEFF